MHSPRKLVARYLPLGPIAWVSMVQVTGLMLQGRPGIFSSLTTAFLKGTDIDTLCVFPKHVEREHFFTIMYDMLKERPEVTELTVSCRAKYLRNNLTDWLGVSLTNYPLSFSLSLMLMSP